MHDNTCMNTIIMKGENYRYNGFRTVVLAIQNWDLIGFGDDAWMILVRLRLDDTRSRVMRNYRRTVHISISTSAFRLSVFLLFLPSLSQTLVYFYILLAIPNPNPLPILP
jgi:hypothetical protein